MHATADLGGALEASGISSSTAAETVTAIANMNAVVGSRISTLDIQKAAYVAQAQVRRSLPHGLLHLV
jgi:hypothetical protein